MVKVKYEEMFPHELEKAIKKCPIIYIPCGLLEWHSSHLPLGIDGLKIEELGCRIALKYGGVVMPPIYIGMPGYTSFQGTITYRQPTVHRVFVETFEQLEKIGFKVIVAIGGHYGKPQEMTLKGAADEFTKQSKVVVWVLSEAELIQDLAINGGHAGPWETSMGIELCGHLVELNNFSPGKQKLKRYSIPQRPDGFDFEYSTSDFVIEQDLRKILKPEQISRHVALVVDRIGKRALELLRASFG